MDVVSKEQAAAAREQLRAFREAQKAEKAARQERRTERAEEIARNREAERLAQSRIDALKHDADETDIAIADLRAQIAERKAKLATLHKREDDIAKERSKEYSARQAARDALSALHSEIVGRNGEAQA